MSSRTFRIGRRGWLTGLAGAAALIVAFPAAAFAARQRRAGREDLPAGLRLRHRRLLPDARGRPRRHGQRRPQPDRRAQRLLPGRLRPREHQQLPGFIRSAPARRTRFRVDLRGADADRLNLGGDQHIDAVADEETGALLTPAEHRDPLRNRGLLRTPLAPAVSTQDADLFLPFGRRPAA